MVKMLVLLVTCLVIASAIGFVFSSDNSQVNDDIYQGPVPQGYDEEHFRKTGETILEVEN